MAVVEDPRAAASYEENPYYYVEDGYVPDWVEDGYDPYGVSDTVEWYCPVCGSGCNGSVCWYCGYVKGSSGYVPDWIEDGYDPYAYAYDYDYDDIWGDGYALDWD